jgi:asparagine synthase (glutamine-hydrolysing)
VCGIAGIVSSSVSDEIFLKALNLISYRGPDDTGFFAGIDQKTQKKVLLGINRLSIIDIQGGKQPMKSEDGNIVVVFNGEIYNFLELRRKLEGKHFFRTNSDTEIIPHMWEEYRESMLDYFDGMFAIALYDSKENILFLARDPFGEKPLYYSLSQNQFIFASEPKVIISLADFSPEPDFYAIAKYLFYGFIPSPHSAFSKIKKIPAGHYLIFDLKNWDIKIKEYFQVKKIKTRDSLGIQDIKHQIKENLYISVKRRLIADVPLGIFLSGGIDSSSVVAIASEFTKPKTFSISFYESSYDESSFAREISSFFGTDHTEYRMREDDMLEVIPEIFSKLDEPFADSSILPTYLLSKLTRQKVKVALSGDGGDELFGGYPTYISHILAELLRRILRWKFKDFVVNLIESLPSSFEYFSLDFKLKRFFSGFELDLPQRHYFWMRYFSPSEITNILNLDIKQDFIFEDALRYYKEASEKDIDFFSLPMYLDMKLYLQDDILFKTDRASSFCSLEVRTPFLTREIANLCFSLKFKDKIRPLIYTLDGLKFILRDIMKEKLPKRILKRGKQGFAVPISFWIKKKERIFAEKIFELEKYLRRFGVLSPSFSNFVSKEFYDHINSRKNNSRKIFALFSLSQWIERWIR